ncbi:MAG: sugar phosphate isomerase/epimerase [Chloroflexi bacterium]|nr:sugar phosphate isomerase/epimerase [Chloroflexota bacterium]
MRLGISGTLLPDDIRDLTPEAARTLRSWGYTGVFTRLGGNDPLDPPSDAECRRFRDVLADAGLDHYMATGYWQNLVHPVAGTRRRNVEVLCAALRLAGRLGATCIDTGPGSMSDTGPWSPHPENWAPWAETNLVDSLGRAAEVAAEVGVRIHLEGHQYVTLRDAGTTRRVVDAVGSPWVRVDMDPVNWITLDTYYDTGSAIDSMFDTLGERIGSGHSKDISIWDRHTVHLDTVTTGRGAIDHQRYMQRLEALDPDIYLIVEGCSTEDAAGVYSFLAGEAERAGVVVR